jgi:hypothetical protein
VQIDANGTASAPPRCASVSLGNADPRRRGRGVRPWAVAATRTRCGRNHRHHPTVGAVAPVAQSHAFSSGRSPNASATEEKRRTLKGILCGEVAGDASDPALPTASAMRVVSSPGLILCEGTRTTTRRRPAKTRFSDVHRRSSCVRLSWTALGETLRPPQAERRLQRAAEGCDGRGGGQSGGSVTMRTMVSVRQAQ